MRSRQRSPAARSRRARRQRSPGSTRPSCERPALPAEKVAQGNLLRTASDDVEDEDEDIGDAEAIDDCDP
jgi:hypothetical protein